MKVTLKDSLGTDLTVVNAARVSFSKQSDWEIIDNLTREVPKKVLSEKDTKLINYLAKHGHWTPFGHPQIQVHVKAPIFAARQLGKHQVGLVWNEVSRRYVDSAPEFYRPEYWRGKAENKKQGSDNTKKTPYENLEYYDTYGTGFYEIITEYYISLLDSGVCPEQARMVLPQSMYTEWYWTGSLYAFSRIYNLRIKEDTQEETREIAKELGTIIEPLFPVSWKALTNG